MLKKIVYIGFIIFFLVLVGRSFQFAYRTYIEFKYPPETVFQISPCQTNSSFSSYEEAWLYNYLKLGKICEKP